MVLRKQKGSMQKKRKEKKNVNKFLTPYTKNDVKLDYRFKYKNRTIKLLGENTGRKLLDIHLRKFFCLYIYSQARKTKAKIM